MDRREFIAEQLARLPHPADRKGDPNRNWREEIKSHDALFGLDDTSDEAFARRLKLPYTRQHPTYGAGDDDTGSD